ncbi:MAG: DUF2750 domain-containing protein [Vibrionaceae bacterium]
MQHELNKKEQEIMELNAELRARYLFSEVHANGKIWILRDEDGCVMLNSEGEDVVPVWPSAALAASWVSGEWQDCRPEAITLSDWYSKWTSGLSDDELAVAVFPRPDGDGFVMSAEEFDVSLKEHKTGKK